VCSRVDDDDDSTELRIASPVMHDPNGNGSAAASITSARSRGDYRSPRTCADFDEHHVDGFRYDNVPGFYDGDHFTARASALVAHAVAAAEMNWLRPCGNPLSKYG